MKKIIGWFKNILMRILEVVNYMVKKDNEIELAKLEVTKAKMIFAKDVINYTLSNRKILFFLGCTGIGLTVVLGCGSIGLLYISTHDFNMVSSI